MEAMVASADMLVRGRNRFLGTPLAVALERLGVRLAQKEVIRVTRRAEMAAAMAAKTVVGDTEVAAPEPLQAAAVEASPAVAAAPGPTKAAAAMALPLQGQRFIVLAEEL